MKNFKIILFFVISSSVIKAQCRYAGYYQNYFGSTIFINSDSTFRYDWNFDGIRSFTEGKWKVIKDTLIFQMIPLYDTLVYEENGLTDTKLILSSCKGGQRVNQEKKFLNEINSGGQNRKPWPEKLFYKKEKLFEIKQNGKLQLEKRGYMYRNKKYDPWYRKINVMRHI